MVASLSQDEGAGVAFADDYLPLRVLQAASSFPLMMVEEEASFWPRMVVGLPVTKEEFLVPAAMERES